MECGDNEQCINSKAKRKITKEKSEHGPLKNTRRLFVLEELGVFPPHHFYDLLDCSIGCTILSAMYDI